MSDGYDPEYDRDEYLAIENEERGVYPRWKVCGAVKVRILQTHPDTGDDDTDAEIWLHVGWVGPLDSVDEDEAKEAIIDELAPQIDKLLREEVTVEDITEASLDWEVYE